MLENKNSFLAGLLDVHVPGDGVAVGQGVLGVVRAECIMVGHIQRLVGF